MITTIKTYTFAGLILASIAGLIPLQAMEIIKENTFLNPNNRPIDIQMKVDQSFNKLALGKISDWNFNGNDEYYILCGLNQYQLLKSIIKNQPEKKEFYILDIGAGNFKWGQGLAKFLQSQSDLPQGITVHIMGIRGEQHIHSPQNQNGPYQLHEFGGFKIEDMHNVFLERGWDLSNKIDLIVSAWTFRHLVDPVGTLVQAYNLLCPETGVMLFDGFCFNYGNTSNAFQEKPNITISENLTSLLLDFKAPFLIYPDSGGQNNSHMIRKAANPICQISLTYNNVDFNPCHRIFRCINSACLTSFKETRKEIDIPMGIVNRDSHYGQETYYGDRKLFNWLISERIIFLGNFEEFPKNS